MCIRDSPKIYTNFEPRARAPYRNPKLCSQLLTERISKDNILKLMKTLKKEYKPCGVGLSIYKPLWSTNAAPSYTWALDQVRKCLSDEELGKLKSIAK